MCIKRARLAALGVLRAIGLRGRTVWWELVKESLILGIAGVTIGIPLGVALGRLFLPIVATTSALAFALVAPAAELTVQPISLLLAVFLGRGARWKV